MPLYFPAELGSGHVTIPATFPQMLNVWTWGFVLQPGTQAAGRCFLVDETDLAFNYYCRLSWGHTAGGGGDIQMEVGRATADTLRQTNTHAMGTLYRPYVVVITFDVNQTVSGRIYCAPFGAPLMEQTINAGLGQNGSGALLTGTPAAFPLCNTQGATPNRSGQGPFWSAAKANYLVGVNEMFNFAVHGIGANLGFWKLGEEGSSFVADRTGRGNYGAIAGTTWPTMHNLPSLPVPELPYWFVPAAAGKPWLYYAQQRQGAM